MDPAEHILVVEDMDGPRESYPGKNLLCSMLLIIVMF